MGAKTIYTCDACEVEVAKHDRLTRWSFVSHTAWLLADLWVCVECVARVFESAGVAMPDALASHVSYNRVPGPLAAGPGGSGETRGASDASTGVEADSQPRASDACPEHGTHGVGDCDTDT